MWWTQIRDEDQFWSFWIKIRSMNSNIVQNFSKIQKILNSCIYTPFKNAKHSPRILELMDGWFDWLMDCFCVFNTVPWDNILFVLNLFLCNCFTLSVNNELFSWMNLIYQFPPPSSLPIFLFQYLWNLGPNIIIWARAMYYLPPVQIQLRDSNLHGFLTLNWFIKIWTRGK